MNTRIFVLDDSAKVTSLGLFNMNSQSLAGDVIAAAEAKGLSAGGIFLTDIELYRLIDTGREALNTP